MTMKEVSIHQIAEALAGHPGGQWPELRLLMLFQSQAADRVKVEPQAAREPLSKAA